MRNACTLLALGSMLFFTSCGSAAPTLVPSYTPASMVSPAPGSATAQARVPTANGMASPIEPATLSTTAVVPTEPERDPATPTGTAPPPTPAPPAVTFSANGLYAFPVAGDLALMTWTHYHWDGSNAVDIEAARRLSGSSEEFKTFTQLPVVSVVSGTVAIADNRYGGLALLLRGNDGYTYYYGHLSEQWVPDGQFVQAGEHLGRIGNTGHNSQYIEPHLHFSIASGDASDWRWEPDVNAAEQFVIWFDLPWQDLEIADYAFDRVSGWPLASPAQVTRGFSEPLAQNPDQGSIDILPISGGTNLLPVYATLNGEVNVNRATVMGLRAQITNRPARTTVVYSFLAETTVADGDVVQRGDVVGYVSPTVALNYMLFVNDIPTDPVPTLGDPPKEP
jgi:murein DD-endopeptidase MepM/ murein hydrolase activator NlpD